MTATLTYDDVLAFTGGRVLATSPAHGWARSDGSWEIVRALGKGVTRRLVIVGMAGAELTAVQMARRVSLAGGVTRTLRGSPAGPDELAFSCTERGLLPAAGSSTWDAGACVDWYVSAVLAVQADKHSLSLEDEPEPEPLPAWVAEWVGRLVCPVKREYALNAARSIYWRTAEPLSLGREWEAKVWGKLGRRFSAEMGRNG